MLKAVAQVIGSGAATAYERAPAASDDATQGYAVGDEWLDGNGALWTCARATAGNAVWQKLDAAPLPGDVLAVGPVAAYGTRRLRADYTGVGLTIGRASDSVTQVVPFLDAGGLDTDLIDRHVIGTTSTVQTWHDQSGNARNATFETTYSGVTMTAPQVTPFASIGPNYALNYDATITSDGGSYIRNALVMPTSVTGSNRACSVVLLHCSYHSQRYGPLIQLSASTIGNSLVWSTHENDSQRGPVLYNTNTTRGFAGTYQFPVIPIVSGFTSAATAGGGVALFAEGRKSVTGLTQCASDTWAGGLVGANTQIAPSGEAAAFGGYLGAVLVYDYALTAAQFAEVGDALVREFLARPQARGVLNIMGDSISEGGNAAWFQGHLRQMLPILSRPVQPYMHALAGSTWSARIDQIDDWQPCYDAGAPFNLATLAWGSNDIFGGATLAELQEGVATYISTMQAANPWSFGLVTVLPRTNITGGAETIRQQYNDWLRSNWQSLGAVMLVDIAADATMGATNANLDTTLYVDGTHLTRLGHSYLAAIYATQINAFLARAGR